MSAANAVVTAPLNISEQIAEKILSLQSALSLQHPTYPVLLREIHQTLKSYPEQVTLLDDEQIGVIVNGLKLQTRTEIATVAIKNSKTKSLKSIGVGDL